MANIDWPASLQQKLNTRGFREVMGGKSIEFQPEFGPPKKRIRSLTDPDQVNVTIYINRSQYLNLRSFFKLTTRAGSLRFNFIHPHLKSSKEARFMEKPVITPLNNSGTHFLAQMKWLFYV